MTESVRTLLARFLAVFRRPSLDRELDAELRSHLDMAVERNLAQGMNREQARRQALLDFGGLEQTKQLYRERRGLPFLDALFQDLRFAFRMLGKSPGFTSVAILTLALGIGANTAIFSAIHAVLLRPLPFANANRLVFVWATDKQRGVEEDVSSYPNFEDWKAQSKTLEALAAFTTRSAIVSSGEGAEMVPAIQGTPGIFELLGVSPELGRTFRQEESEPGSSHVLILSDGFWKRAFGADPHIIGRTHRRDRAHAPRQRGTLHDRRGHARWFSHQSSKAGAALRAARARPRSRSRLSHGAWPAAAGCVYPEGTNGDEHHRPSH